MGLLFICMLIYQAWIIDYGPKREATAPAQENIAPATGNVGLNGVNEGNQVTPSAGDLPAGNSSVSAVPSQSSTATAAVSTEAGADAGGEQRVSVKTDVIDVTLSSIGGTIVGVDLLEYPVSLKESETLIKLRATPLN